MTNELQSLSETSFNNFALWLCEKTKAYLEVPDNKRNFEKWKKERRSNET